MLNFKKITLIVLTSIGISSMIILAIALTDLIKGNPFKDCLLVVSIVFLAITVFTGMALKKYV